MKTWLLRSAPLSMTVSLRLSRGRHIPDEILSTAARWRSCCLPNKTSLSVVGQLVEARLENLERLDLGRVEFNGDDFTSFPSFTTATVPRLQKLGLDIRSDTLPLLMPWIQLTDLTLRTHIPNIALDILAQCTNLIRAVVHTPGLAALTEARQGIIALNHLQALSIHFFRAAEHFIPFLSYLSAPALEGVCLDFGETNTDALWSQAHFTVFQLRAPNVTHLMLNCSCLTSDDLRAALHHAPFLTHLEIAYGDCIDDALLDALCYKAGASPLAPRLQNLFLTDIGDNNFTEDILAGMIASRWWTDAELAARLVPPAVARWTRIELHGDELSESFFEMLEYLPSDVLTIY
ncbi:hypothetical protein C8R45DRAFT_975189 [Mycena sanguinolenta]|nr:hypothetical protein C8R45DRAFT_975189 [Mycena sanguinolenta]